MNRKSATLLILGLLPALAACGSTQSSSPAPVTITVPATPDQTTSTGGSTAATSTTPNTATVTTPTTTATTPAQTRTGPAPAFAQNGGTPAPGGDLGTAVNKLRALGFSPLSTRTYDPNETLRVLIGARAAGAQQAFFFDGTKYLGTDAAATSAQVAVTAHGDTDVTLQYGIYKASDRDCCPSGAPRTVHFALDGGRLAPLDPIPTAADRR